MKFFCTAFLVSTALAGSAVAFRGAAPLAFSTKQQQSSLIVFENISKADKACREMKHNEKISFEKVVIPTKRVPHQVMLRSQAISAMVAATIRPRICIKDALKSEYKENWIKAIKSEVVDQVINKTHTLVTEFIDYGKPYGLIYAVVDLKIKYIDEVITEKFKVRICG